MHLLHTFQQWRETRYENHLLQMKDKNKCPDCSGRGFHVYPAHELAFFNESLDCPSCSGTGLYNEWLKELCEGGDNC